MTAAMEPTAPVVDELVLQRLRKYAAIEKTAEEAAQRESLARAADLVALYEGMTWVPEMDEKHPVGRRSFGSGRTYDPHSFSRFTRWLAQVQGVDLKSARQYQLKTAHELIAEHFVSTRVELKPKTEYELRPLARLAKQGYGDRIPDIWQQVTAEGKWTAKTVTETVSEFRKAWTPGQRRSASATEKYSMLKSRILSAVEKAYEVSPRTAAEAIFVELERHPDIAQALIPALLAAYPPGEESQ